MKEEMRLSLEGLSIGDAFGESLANLPKEDRRIAIETRALPPAPMKWSDDTSLALGVYLALGESDIPAPIRFAELYLARYKQDPNRGFGPGAIAILEAMNKGIHWVEASRRVFGGMGSMGNGAAMRAGLIGASFGPKNFDGSLADRVYRAALNSALPTHAHPDAQAGAIAVATAAFAATNRPYVSGNALLSFVAANTPAGATRDGLEKAKALPDNLDPQEAADILGKGSKVISSDTVPFALWCAARHMGNFEEAMWATASVGGDIDTNCAIVGSIVALSVGLGNIPTNFREAREPLPINLKL